MVSFLSWYAFPPLTPITLKTDLNLSANDIANANIVALLATFLVRVLVGPLCDRFGPRKCMVGCMIAGAIPTALAGTAHNASGLIAIRFFVGILGGTFVPCQVWCTGFFDKNCVGRANAIAAGWGNAGGGITYFVMPAYVSSMISSHPKCLRFACWTWVDASRRLACVLCNCSIHHCCLCGPDDPVLCARYSNRRMERSSS